MAYVSQARKKALVANCKKVLAKYGMKATFSVRHKSTLVCTLREGGIDFVANFKERKNVALYPRDVYGDTLHNGGDINTYWLEDNWNDPALSFLKELKDAMNGRGTDDENFDKSNIHIDYFHVGWYIDINIGVYDKPYVLNPELAKEVA